MLQSNITIYPAFSIQLNGGDLPLAAGIALTLAVVQVLLSRREPWWPGLASPLLWFLWMAAGIVRQVAMFGGGAGLRPALAALLIESIPALILLLIHAVCRRTRRKRLRRQMKKSRIDDL